MKKWYITPSTNILINEDNDYAERVGDNYTSLCSCYIAPEDCIVKFSSSKEGGFDEYQVKKGQILFTFYSANLPNQLVIFDSDALRENIESYNKDIQEEKEKWAESKANTNVNDQSN